MPPTRDGDRDTICGATGYISNRLDVPTFPWRVPQPGSIKTYTQEAVDKKDDLFPILTEVFGR
jgi:hypothetical protein